MFLFVSFIVSSWTEGGAGGSGLESLVLLSNHFFSFCFSTVRLFVGCSVHQEALYHHWASPLAPSAVRLCCRPLVEETEGRWSRCYCHRTEHFSSRVFLVFGDFSGFLKAEQRSVSFHASRGCCFLK